MAQEGLLALGGFFVVMGIWWLVQVTKRYYHSKERQCDFHSSVTFPCCNAFHKHPVEGIFKFLSSVTIATTLFIVENKTLQSDTYLSNVEFGTLFMFMALSGAIDVMAGWSRTFFYNGLDYVSLFLFFAIETLFMFSHSRISSEPMSTLYSLNLFTSLMLMIVVILELKYKDQVLCPVVRSYLLLVQGSWNLEVSYILTFNVPLGKVSEQTDLLTMYFSWHCGAAFVFVILLWLLVFKLMQNNCCLCNQNSASLGTEMVYLENRVRFDYDVMDRFDSDID